MDVIFLAGGLNLFTLAQSFGTDTSLSETTLTGGYPS
jgi:hypothetical protein